MVKMVHEATLVGPKLVPDRARTGGFQNVWDFVGRTNELSWE